MRITTARLALSLVLLVALAACSNGTSASPSSGATTTSATASASGASSAEEYADGVCTAVGDWLTAIQNEGSTFSSAMPATPNAGDLSGVKTALQTYIANVVDATQSMVDSVKALGTPDVTGGTELATNLQSALQSVEDLFTQMKSDIDSLDANNPAGMLQQLSAMTTKLQQGSQDVSAAFDKLANSQSISDQLGNVASCQALSSVAPSA